MFEVYFAKREKLFIVSNNLNFYYILFGTLCGTILCIPFTRLINCNTNSVCIIFSFKIHSKKFSYAPIKHLFDIFPLIANPSRLHPLQNLVILRNIGEINWKFLLFNNHFLLRIIS